MTIWLSIEVFELFFADPRFSDIVFGVYLYLVGELEGKRKNGIRKLEAFQSTINKASMMYFLYYIQVFWYRIAYDFCKNVMS